MNEEEMKDKILDLIECIYKKKYIGRIKVWKDQAWNVRLGMNNDERPIFISAELPDDKFLKFFRRELQDRGWNVLQYFTGVKSYPRDYINNDTK